MVTLTFPALLPRQSEIVTDEPEVIEVPFWFTRTGQIIRISVFFGIILLGVLYAVLGRWHARRRIQKGKVPLRYHRWLLNRDERARYDPSYENPSAYYSQYQYRLNPLPPPTYDPNAAMPPTYQPPEGGSKVDPSQWRSPPTRRPAEDGDETPEYTAPPAAAVRADYTGASTTSNNPYRL